MASQNTSEETIQPIKVSFSAEVMEAMKTYVDHNIESIERATKILKEQKITKWRKLYKGTPDSEKKSFPWPNASNLVVQLIGTHCDTLRARVLGSIYEVLPLFTTALTGEWKDEEKGEEQRRAFEEFMNDMGLEADELDLYRIESQAADEAIKFGTTFVKAPWERDVEQEAVSMSGTDTIFKSFVKYEGPRPEKLAFEDFGISPEASSLESANFKFHRRRLKKTQLEERMWQKLYDKDKVEAILGKPDRSNAIFSVAEDLRSIGVYSSGSEQQAEWDLYECYLVWWKDGHKYRIIYTYHKNSKTCLRAIFNFYPKNAEPMMMGRLGYTGDTLYGFGFCEMLEHYQAEVSTGHNQRVDARTLANTSVIRVSRSSGLDSSVSMYPMAVIPAETGELEVVNLGRPVDGEINSETLTLRLASDRSGVEPAVSGGGAGGPNKKAGGYSAMGSFSVMQSGNRRSNLNTTDLRYLHTKIGKLCGMQYAHFGIGSRIQTYGKQSEFLKKALQSIKDGRMVFPIRAATASINREVEKQNDMLLMNVMRQHNAGITQILQALPAATDPIIKDFLIKVVGTSSMLMRNIIKNFGHEDIDRFVPEPNLDAYKQQQQQPGGGAPPNLEGNSGQPSSHAQLAPTIGGGSPAALSGIPV